MEGVTFPALVFVYGTLKKGCGNNRVLGDSKLIDSCKTATPNYIMTRSGIPFVRKTDTGEQGHYIRGEMYRVEDEATMRDLDCLEGHPSFYCREQIELDNGETAWIYLCARDAHVVEIDDDNCQTYR